MACGKCGKAKKSFKHKVRQAILDKSLGTPQPVITKVEALPVKPKKKRKRGMSKRALWIRQKRREARRASRILQTKSK